MSARAAARLETLGFSNVHEYAAGKMDWLAAGLPSEGEYADELTAKDAMRMETAACRLDDQAGAAGHEIDKDTVCVVLDERGVVLGRVARSALRERPDARVEDVMSPGPVTFRPNVSLRQLTERMQDRKVRTVLITDPDGRLLGVLHRKDAERMLREAHSEEE
jgi:Mg/Co/Ni transporter MgtE